MGRSSEQPSHERSNNIDEHPVSEEVNSFLTPAVRRFFKYEIINRERMGEAATLYWAVQSLKSAPKDLLKFWFEGEVEESIDNITMNVHKMEPSIELVHLLDGQYFVTNTGRTF